MENGPWPKPSAYHSASFQPSPNESIIFSVQVAPTATDSSDSDAYGAPPATLVPSVHPKVQLTSLGQFPAATVILDGHVGIGSVGGGGGWSGGGGPLGGDGGRPGDGGETGGRLGGAVGGGDSGGAPGGGGGEGGTGGTGGTAGGSGGGGGSGAPQSHWAQSQP